jgi:hypothetical protein
MAYLSCPQCGLSLRLRTDSIGVVNCPRCAGRMGELIMMEPSDTRPITGRSVGHEPRWFQGAVPASLRLAHLPPGD